jgi:catechol 2,3-dioxygenase-like lactoylglutathione lyase family enzyme
MSKMSNTTTNKGFSHVGLSTLDLDKTREFYEKILGFKVVVADTIKIKEGGAIRHIFFDTGRDQLLAFMEPRGVPGVPVEYDAGINRGLGTPAAFYHFAFEAGSPPALEDKRPTGCRSSTAASRVTSPRTTPRCRSDSRFRSARSDSTKSTPRRSPRPAVCTTRRNIRNKRGLFRMSNRDRRLLHQTLVVCAATDRLRAIGHCDRAIERMIQHERRVRTDDREENAS